MTRTFSFLYRKVTEIKFFFVVLVRCRVFFGGYFTIFSVRLPFCTFHTTAMIWFLLFLVNEKSLLHLSCHERLDFCVGHQPLSGLVGKSNVPKNSARIIQVNITRVSVSIKFFRLMNESFWRFRLFQV